MDANKFLQGKTRETTIRRDALGRWSQDGFALSHPNLTRSFDRWLGKAEDGRYCLKNDINWAYVTVDGPPVFVRSVVLEGKTAMLRLSNDKQQPLEAPSLRQGAEDDALYCDVEGSLTARFDGHAASQLAPLLGEDERGVYVNLQGHKHYPPRVDNPIR